MTDKTLDTLLGDWAARHTLPTAQAEFIRQSIVASPHMTVESLPTEWWQRFFGKTMSSWRQTSPWQWTNVAPAYFIPPAYK
jgi:hypothetical protein